MSSKQVEFLVKLRDAFSMAAEATNEYLESLAPSEVRDEKKPLAAVQEITFNILKFEVQQGAKIGEYEVAYKANNIAEKWTQAYDVLRSSNATIKDRYYGEGYAYSYWTYGVGKIYRQRLKR
jgi:hypothetical protein